jgi:penicillin-binding protein-related factor A (putative recombinase)
MPTYRRVRAGLVAKKEGEQFKLILNARARANGITCIRIPDGCRQVRGPQGQKLLRIRTPFDYCLFYKTQGIVVDAKTTDTNTFTYSQVIDHQVVSLLDAARNTLNAGYIVWHRSIDTVAFYTAKQLYTLKHRQSLTPDQGIKLGNSGNFNILKLFTDPIPITKSIDTTHITIETI